MKTRQNLKEIKIRIGEVEKAKKREMKIGKVRRR